MTLSIHTLTCTLLLSAILVRNAAASPSAGDSCKDGAADSCAASYAPDTPDDEMSLIQAQLLLQQKDKEKIKGKEDATKNARAAAFEAKKSNFDLNQRVSINGVDKVINGYGDISCTCNSLTWPEINNMSSPEVEVCGTGVKLTLYMFGGCGMGLSYEYFMQAPRWEIGTCDTTGPPTGCVTISPAQIALLGAVQSYRITKCDSFCYDHIVPPMDEGATVVEPNLAFVGKTITEACNSCKTDNPLESSTGQDHYCCYYFQTSNGFYEASSTTMISQGQLCSVSVSGPGGNCQD